MKKSLVIALLVLLIASVVIAAGCGSSSGGNDGKNETAEDSVNGGDKVEGEAADSEAGGGDKGGEAAGGEAGGGDEVEGEDPAGYSVVGTYESGEGTFITLNNDGSFESDAWGGKKEGSYKEEKGGAWVRLSFDDGSSASLSVMIGDGRVSAIVDDDTLIQYNRK